MEADQLPKDGLLSLSAEYLVASDLTKLGYAVSLASAGLPYDLVVDTGKCLFKVQVKSTAGQRKRNGTPLQRYIFGIRRTLGKYSIDSFDIIAFVASDLSMIGYMSAGEVAGIGQITLSGPDDKSSPRNQTNCGIHELPFREALSRAIIEKTWSLDEELTKAFGSQS